MDSFGVDEEKDRLCCAILKLSIRRRKGRINAFHKALELDRADYRDLLVEAGFANAVESYSSWAGSIKKSKNLTNQSS